MKTASMFILVSLAQTLALPVGAANSQGEATPHGCEPSNVTATFLGHAIRYSCFEGDNSITEQQLINRQQSQGGQINGSARGASSRGSSYDPTSGMRIAFSPDPKCRFAAGTTMELRNPCLLISDNDQDILPKYAIGYVNRCFPNGGKVYTLGACVASYHRKAGAHHTSGSLTITRWPSPTPLRGSGVVAFRFSPGATVTGFYTKMVGYMPIETEVAVALAGSASMKVSYWSPRLKKSSSSSSSAGTAGGGTAGGGETVLATYTSGTNRFPAQAMGKSLTFKVWGGGGGGEDGTNYNGVSGGGGGGYNQTTIQVNSSDAQGFTVVVGAGGKGNSNGGESLVINSVGMGIISAKGGTGGSTFANTPAPGGSGSIVGGAGSPGTNTTGGAGGNGANGGGSGGTGAAQNQDGINGLSPGGGGGGAGALVSVGSDKVSSGGNGEVIIETP
ncbi:MAG: hypothetical protein HKL90_07780 [Elusimicrobia bacterium]|nr:hypothetical protein [Elusimicrobiota bacterium]